VFKLIIEIIDKSEGNGALKWTIEYEKINEDIHPPNGWMEYLTLPHSLKILMLILSKTQGWPYK
jgi:hypothetical protein